jgi:hypothetical protein
LVFTTKDHSEKGFGEGGIGARIDFHNKTPPVAKKNRVSGAKIGVFCFSIGAQGL